MKCPLSSPRGLKILGMVLLLLLTLTMIYGFSLQPSSESTETSNGVLEKLDPIVTPLLKPIIGTEPTTELKQVFIRKAGHFLEFALLGAEWLALALLLSPKNRLFQCFMPLFSVLFCAVIDELIQSFLDRTSSVRDVCLDLCGGIGGMAVTVILVLLLRRLRREWKIVTSIQNGGI